MGCIHSKQAKDGKAILQKDKSGKSDAKAESKTTKMHHENTASKSKTKRNAYTSKTN